MTWVIVQITEMGRYPVRRWLFRKLDQVRNNRSSNLCSLLIVALTILFIYFLVRILSNTSVRELSLDQMTNLSQKCPGCVNKIAQSSLMGLYYLYAVPGFLIAVSLMSNSKSKQKYVSLSPP